MSWAEPFDPRDRSPLQWAMTLIGLWEMAPAHAPADYREILSELAAVDARLLTHAVDRLGKAIRGAGIEDADEILTAYAFAVQAWTRAEEAVAMAATVLDVVQALAERYR